MVTKLPPGCAGLLIAAVFAAAMSTISTSINCSATLSLTDFYRRFMRRGAGDRESLIVLYGGTLVWGLVGTAAGLAMIGVKAALDTWWQISGAFSGGMLGLFLLGFLSRRVSALAAFLATLAGIVAIVGLSFSHSLPEEWSNWKSPFDPLLTIVFGTTIILLFGLLLSIVFPRSRQSR
jgi:SSS family solute:Na+ symporter